MRVAGGWGLRALAVAAFCAGTLEAQYVERRPFPESAPGVSVSPGEDPPGARAVLYSALLPGAGQFALGQRRWAAYTAAEVLGWVLFLDRRFEGLDLRDAYRDLAWTTARGGGPVPRVDGDFEYFETLTQWVRSGSFDHDPELPGVQPETDPSTFNGNVWALAREIFFEDPSEAVPSDDPRYRAALDYYRGRAYGTELEWDWSDAPEELESYRGLIRRSDDRLREATVWLGALAANHVLSAVDAFISSRLRAATGASVRGALRVVPDAPRRGWSVALRVQF